MLNKIRQKADPNVKHYIVKVHHDIRNYGVVVKNSDNPKRGWVSFGDFHTEDEAIQYAMDSMNLEREG